MKVTWKPGSLRGDGRGHCQWNELSKRENGRDLVRRTRRDVTHAILLFRSKNPSREVVRRHNDGRLCVCVCVSVLQCRVCVTSRCVVFARRLDCVNSAQHGLGRGFKPSVLSSLPLSRQCRGFCISRLSSPYSPVKRNQHFVRLANQASQVIF